MSQQPLAEVVQRLFEELGEAVKIDQESLELARSDWSGKKSLESPLCVVEATSTEDVARVLKIANETKTPVVTRGGGSGLAGGAIGDAGEIVLSLARMNRILDISLENRTARVEAGVINQDLNLAAQTQGLWFTPDPASRIWSTVGGNIATNAGGLLCAKYGVTRGVVKELVCVLADGEVMRMGHQTVKGVTGFDLVSLMVGSEGTLAVITEALVSLKPVSSFPVWTISGMSKTIEQATDAVRETIRSGFEPSILELIDERSFGHISRHLGLSEPLAAANQLIAQTEGPGADSQAQAIGEIWKACGLEVAIEDQGEELMRFRRAMLPALKDVGTVLIEDVAVPISKLGEMFSEIRKIEQEYQIEIPTVAHAGDGNLHPNFIYDTPEVPETIWRAADALFRKAVALGGTLTGEHGVGLLKRQWLKEELGEKQWQLQWQIKKLFDPNNILNPGKVFDPSHIKN